MHPTAVSLMSTKLFFKFQLQSNIARRESDLCLHYNRDDKAELHGSRNKSSKSRLTLRDKAYPEIKGDYHNGNRAVLISSLWSSLDGLCLP